MDASQDGFCFRFQAPEPGGQNCVEENPTGTRRVLPAWATTIDDVLALAQRTPGWNNRSAPPQRVTLDGGCPLVVVPAHLWRSASCVRSAPVCAPIPFPQGRRTA